jgi:FtsP/CotA-like multicopper oxidase with cupredoxin domain
MKKKGLSIFTWLILVAVALCLGVSQTAAEKRQLPTGHLEQALEARQQADPNFMKNADLSQTSVAGTPAASGGANTAAPGALKAAPAVTPGIPNPAVGFNQAVDYASPNFSVSPPIEKFIDTLPGLGAANASTNGGYIPVAVPDTTTYPGNDYYELSMGEYTQKLASDMPGLTTLRGYEQTNTQDPAVKIHQYAGPLILAHSGKPVRLKVTNNLPIETPAAPQVSSFFLPVDTNIMGAGMGPGPGTDLYTQNRANIHLHGGFTPWISDGTPHQWFTPPGQTTSYSKGVSFQNVPDMVSNPSIPSPCAATTGCFAQNPADGIGTYYYTNQQSARLMFYHDHAYGITRLNVYAGMVAPYLLVDSTEDGLISAGSLPNQAGLDKTSGVAPTSGGIYTYGIPLIIQDKSFVNDVIAAPAGFTGTLPKTTAATDPLWSTYVPNYTTGGSLWFPHEYMPNENIYDPTGFNTLGRWDYGPFMSPPLLAKNFTLPTPTIIPESYGDTILVNGTPYPKATLPPSPVRFRVLNGSNDRMVNLQLYYAVDNATGVVCKGGNTFTTANCTEVSMVPAIPPSNTNPACSTPVSVAGGGLAAAALDPVTGNPINGTGLQTACWPSTWPTDGRSGGVPDPTTAGPPIIQIGNEGGFMPAPAVIPSTPINFEYNRRAVTVLDTTAHALMMAPAERADVIVDFSSVPPGSTLILYNDMPAPTPLYDSRNDYFTNDPDQTTIGGAPITVPGWGPNTRTIMQINVPISGTPGTPISVSTLSTALGRAYAASQARPIVPAKAYNNAFPGAYTTDVHVQNPDQTLNLTGAASPLSKVMTTGPGIGYTTAPTVTFVGGNCSPVPTATATLNGVTAITVTVAGSLYTSAPTVAITGGGGTGATAIAQLSGGVVSSINMVTFGSGYTTVPTVTLTGGGGTGATATATISPNSVGDIKLTNVSSCTTAPYVYITGGSGTGATAAAILTGDTILEAVAITEGFDLDYGRMNVLLSTTPNLLNPNAVAAVAGAVPGYIDPPSDYWYPGQTKVFRVTHLGVDSHVVHFHLGNLQVVNRVDWTNTYMPPDANELGWKESIRTYPFTDLILASNFPMMVLPFQIPQSNRLLDPTSPAGSSANFPATPPVAGQVVPAALTNVMTNFGWEYVWHCHLLGHEENDMMRPLVFQATAPPAPTTLTGQVNASPFGVTLSWTGTFPTATDFAIQRATNTAFTGATTWYIAAPAPSYTDNTAVAGTRYYYRMLAYNSAGSSAWSNTATVVTVLPPAITSATPRAGAVNDSLVVNWTYTTGTPTNFTIQRSNNLAFTNGLVNYTAAAGRRAATLTAQPKRVTRYYRMRANTPVGSSGWSNIMTVKLP